MAAFDWIDLMGMTPQTSPDARIDLKERLAEAKCSVVTAKRKMDAAVAEADRLMSVHYQAERRVQALERELKEASR